MHAQKNDPNLLCILAGAIRDATGSYQIVHIVNAVFIFVGATGMFLYPLVQKLEKKRQAELKESDWLTNDRCWWKNAHAKYTKKTRA